MILLKAPPPGLRVPSFLTCTILEVLANGFFIARPPAPKMRTFSRKYVIATYDGRRTQSTPVSTTAKPIPPVSATGFSAPYLTSTSSVPLDSHHGEAPSPPVPLSVERITSFLAEISLEDRKAFISTQNVRHAYPKKAKRLQKRPITP